MDACSSSNGDSTSDGGVQSNEFVAFRTQLEKVQDLINRCNNKIVNMELNTSDLIEVEREIRIMTVFANKVTSKEMRSSYVPYKTNSLKTIQESYRISNWLMEKRSKEMDNVFDINSFIDLIFSSCAGKENPLYHINTLFDNVMKNTNYFGLNFFCNTYDTSEPSELTQQCKKQIRRSQKRPLEERVVPVEVDNDVVDNELKKNLIKIKSCLKRAQKRNHGEPLSFHKFAIDPYSLTHTVENVFHLASLVKDKHVKIEKVSDDENSEFATISEVKKRRETSSNETVLSSLFTINYDLWKYYINKYNITEQMIEQDDE